MKRYIIALAVVPLLFTGCGTALEDLDYTSDTDNTNQTTLETSNDLYEQTTDTTITDSLEDSDSTTDSSYTSEDSQEEVSTEETITLEEVTTAPIEETTTVTNILSSYGDEEQLMSLATSLYDVACEMYWNYYYSSPYPIDYEQSVEDSNGFAYFLVDDTSITSLEDVRQDWFEVFTSTKDPQDFDGHFIERDGRVYVNSGDRGSDIYYSNTEMTSIVSTVDNEVTFSAVSHYIEPSDGSFVEDKTSEFSIILENGSYHVGEFTLPY